MIVYGQTSCICLYDNEGHKSKTKDSVYNTDLFPQEKIRR